MIIVGSDERVNGGGGWCFPSAIIFYQLYDRNLRKICYNYGRQKTLEQMVDSLLLVYPVEFHSARAASGEWFIATAAVGFSSEAVRWQIKKPDIFILLNKGRKICFKSPSKEK